jgi:hypothetical protein
MSSLSLGRSRPSSSARGRARRAVALAVAAGIAAASALVVAPAASAAELDFAVTSPANLSTVDSTTPTFAGTGTTDDTVVLTYSGQNLLTYEAGRTTVDADGNWSTPTSFESLQPGEDEVRVRVTATTPEDIERGAFFITITLPEAPVAESPFTVTSPTEGETRADTLNLVPYTGTGGAGNTIEIRYFDGRGGVARAGIGEVKQDGTFSVLTNFGGLPAGQKFANTFVRQLDADGALVADELGITIFFAQAPVPAFPFAVTSPQNGSAVDSITPTFEGTATPENTVRLTYSGQGLDTYVAGEALVEDDGTWSTSTDFSSANFGETETRVIATEYLPSGEPAPSSGLAITITFPEAPVPAVPFTVTTPVDGDTVPVGVVTYEGTGVAGNTVTVTYFDGRGGLATAGSGTVDDDGAFSVVAVFDGLPAGQTFANTFVTQTDADGAPVAREIGITLQFEVAPVPLPLDAPVLDEPTVVGTTATFTGTGEPGALVAVAVLGEDDLEGFQALAAVETPAALTTTVAADGTFSVSAEFEPGAYTATAAQGLQDGTAISGPSNTVEFEIAAVAPPAPPTTPAGGTDGTAGADGELASTGGDAGGAFALGGLALLAGLVLVVARSLTRSRTTI